MGMILLAALAVLIAVILVRTLRFTPPALKESSPEAVSYDEGAAIDALAQLIRCKTISYGDHSLEDDAEFEKLIALLPKLYPNVFKTCEFAQLPDRALLFTWKGREGGEPAVLMAHYDVVPVEEENWEKPPFEAVIEDGVMWGRGTLDTKVTFNGVLSAAENLIAQGFVPKKDIYFAFSGGEEVNGQGAVNIVKYFEQRGIVPAMVLDEGGAVVENVFPGVKKPCAMVGIAEKGMMNVTYSVSSGGGHASAPAGKTPIGRLSGGELNALVRTTVAFTQMKGSKAPNVIPPSASMVSNMRLNPADSVASALEYLKKTVADDNVILTVGDHMEPSPISRTDCEGWERVKNAVGATWPGCIVSPYLMVQCSDSRHYRDLSDKVYRFSAMALTSEERKTIHGNNERIRVEAIGKAVEFFVRVMKQC